MDAECSCRAAIEIEASETMLGKRRVITASRVTNQSCRLHGRPDCLVFFVLGLRGSWIRRKYKGREIDGAIQSEFVRGGERIRRILNAFARRYNASIARIAPWTPLSKLQDLNERVSGCASIAVRTRCRACSKSAALSLSCSRRR